MSAIRAVLVEDDVRLRSSLGKMLETAQPPLVLCGSWASVREALAGLASPDLAFDVALVDLRLADGSGLEVIRAMRASHPQAAVVAITIFDDNDTVLGAIRAGATGYLLKDWEPAQIIAHVRDAAAGGAPMSPRVARLVLDHVRGEHTGPVEPLTAREREVLVLLCSGRSYAEAAENLEVSLSTIQTHVKAVYGKLGVHSKAELTALAFRQGLVG